MDYEKLITETKKEADFENLQKELNVVEGFIDKCLKFICECSTSTAERDYRVSSL